jgi:hypothetical protein
MNNDLTWFNQKYFYHSDSEFNTNGGSLEISINSNTSDFQTYSIPTLNISIFNEKIRSNVNLKYQDVLDLLFSIEEINKDINNIYNGGGSEIKKIINGKNFKIGFKTSQNTGKKAVLLLIANSATDFGIIVISYNLFLIIVELLKSFKENYIKLPFEISNRSTLNYILDELKEIKEFNKSLPSSITNLTSSNHILNELKEIKELNKPLPNLTSSMEIVNTNEVINKDKDKDILHISDITHISPEQDPPWDINNEDADKAQKDFEDFMMDNINKVKIPEFDKISNEIKEEQKSFFIEEVLKNDIKNLDSFLISLTMHSNPIEKFQEIIGGYINSTLPSITNDELKSACYYSKRFFLYNVQNYMRNHVSIPVSIPIIKYKPNEFNNENIDLAYDLLTLSMYVRIVKDKLTTKIDDISINGLLLYTSLRVYTDIFTFSFLDNIDSDIIIKCVIKRFQNFSIRGLFKSFNELLKQYGFSDVEEIEINNFTSQIVKRVIGPDKTLYIQDLHQKEYNDNKLKLSYFNDLSLDQIDEFIKAEIETKLEIINTSTKYDDKILKILNPVEKDNSVEVSDNNNWFENINS